MTAFSLSRVAALILVLATLPCPLLAQKRVEVGAFIDYLDISQTNTSNFGLGARFGYRVHHDVMLEGEVAYDYGLNFNEAYLNIVNGHLTAIERTTVGVTHG